MVHRLEPTIDMVIRVRIGTIAGGTIATVGGAEGDTMNRGATIDKMGNVLCKLM